VTCGGSAGRTDPCALVCVDLTRAKGDPLLRECRKSLRKLYGFEGGKTLKNKKGKMNKPPQKWNIIAVYSTEPQKALPEDNDASSLRRCDGPLGTAVFVTGTSGFGTFHSSVVMLGMFFLDGTPSNLSAFCSSFQSLPAK
jgi:tRNA A37 threonylcarbamoyladenosine dehydratase